MSDAEQVSQALAELWDIVKCRCNEAYTGRGLHDPDCQCDSTDALQIVTHRIEALEAKLATCEKYRDAYADCDRIGTQAVRDLESKLALVTAAYRLEAMRRDDYSHEDFEHHLAEIKGESHE